MYTLPIGTTITSPTTTYTITGVLGQGGFGITYSATVITQIGKMRVKASVALKEHFLKADCVRDGETSWVSCSEPARGRVELTRKDFIGEARRLNSISGQNPNIVTVNEVFEANNTAYYAMEMIEGVSLRDYVATHGKLDHEQTLSIMRPIVEAVAFLHRNRITHLDIKPHNIMIATDVDGSLRPVLIDFGLSKHYDESGEPTSTINCRGISDGYAPIEQYAGITTFSPASDVYSLAATMMYCLTGSRLPAAIELTPEVLENALPSSLPTALRGTLTRALSLRAAKRHANAGELLSALGGKPRRPKKAAATDEATVIDAHAKVSAKEATILDTPKLSSNSSATPSESKSKPQPKKRPGRTVKPAANIPAPAPKPPMQPTPVRPAYQPQSKKKSYTGLKIALIVVAICVIGCIYVYNNMYVKVVAPMVYDSVSDSSNGMFLVRKDGKAGFINDYGDIVIPLIYDDAWIFIDGLAKVEKDGKRGIIDMSGSIVVPIVYDDCQWFQEGLLPVEKNGKWGYVDHSGEVVIPLIYDEAHQFSSYTTMVAKDGKWGIIDISGNVVIPLIYDSIHPFNGMYQVTEGNEGYFIDKTGNRVI